MLSAQFLASCSRVSHPSHNVVNSAMGPRNMKNTLKSAHNQDVAPLLSNGVLPEESYSNAKQRLHATFVDRSFQQQDINHILQRRPPPVHKSEMVLPRQYRSALAQLRSGHSILLNSYKHTINASPSPTCPRCGNADETVVHLFDCQTHPTPLSPIDLWLYPTKVAYLLSSLNFPDLSPLPPLLPPPPPEPPPSPDLSPSSDLFSPISPSESFFNSSFSSLDQSLGSILRGAIVPSSDN